MARLGAAALALVLIATWSCSRDRDGAPAPDVASQPATAPVRVMSPEESAAAAAAIPESPDPNAAPASASAETYQPGSREPDYQHIAEIRNAREASTGKLARMYLKFNQHHEFLENTVKMLATDGSYLSVLLHYDEAFKPVVLNMKRGYVYEVEFEVELVSGGGQPRGKILSIDRRSSGPVADQTRFLPAIKAVHAAEALPEHIKEARREKIRNTIENITEAIDVDGEER